MSNNQTVLVTGGLGYIGSHTVVELIQSGYDVVIVDDLSNSAFSTLANIKKISGKEPTFYPINLCNKEKLNEVFVNHFIDYVIHFASFIYVDESMEKPLEYFNNNIVSLLNLLSVMKENEVKNIIFSSSCTVYGQPDKLPISEDTPIKDSPSPYGKTKLMAESMLREISELDNSISAISLRYFNPVGAHESGLIGEKSKGQPKHLFPILFQVVKGEREAVKVFGTDYNTEDGSAIRDYIHVVDLGKAHVKAISKFDTETRYQFYNLGSGKGFSVLEIIAAFERVLEVKIPTLIADRRSGDVDKIWADTQKTERELGWSTEKTLEDMIHSAYRWETN